MISPITSHKDVKGKAFLPPQMVGRCFALFTLFLLPGLNQAWAKSTLWQSQHQGGTLYLMGSIHVLQEGHYPLPKAMEKAFEEEKTK